MTNINVNMQKRCYKIFKNMLLIVRCLTMIFFDKMKM